MTVTARDSGGAAPPRQPLVFVLGDSISMHYGPYLKEFLAPVFRYARKGDGVAAGDLDNASGANGGDSDACLAYIEKVFGGPDAPRDLFLWNCGLHDVKTTDSGRQVPLDRYRRNLEAGAERIRGAGARLAWVRTTAALEAIHNARHVGFRRFHRDVIAYNEAADDVMRRAGASAIDLYGFTLPFGEAAYCDHVHFTGEVRRLQAAFIAGHLWPLSGRAP